MEKKSNNYIIDQVQVSAMKNHIGQETAAIFKRVVKKGIFEEVPCEQGPERSRAAYHVANW